jgi:hypothetical protein
MPVTGWSNASGSQVTLTVEIDFSEAIVEVGTSTAPTLRTLWDSATWDDSEAIWSSNNPVYTDVTSYVLQAQTGRNFSRHTNNYNTGTASLILDNSDGRFSPLNESSPYRVGNYTGIGPLRPARITLNAGFGDVALFTGFVQSWNEKYGSYGANPTVDVSLTSVEGRIGDYTRYASASSGAGESAASRILRILSSVGWLGDTYLATGPYALQATTLEGNALQELQLVADSQGGALWFNGEGDCIFDDISSLQFRLANTFAGTVFTSDKALIESGEAFTYETIEYAYDGELTKNIAQYARVGGTVQTVTDESSRSLYGDRAISRTDLIPTTDTAVAVIAQKEIALNKGPELRVESLSLSGRAQYDQSGYFTAWQQIAALLDLRLGCVVDLGWTPAGALDNIISRSCIIQGVTHTITRNDWNVSVEFTSGTIERAMANTQWDYFNWDEGVWSW